MKKANLMSIKCDQIRSIQNEKESKIFTARFWRSNWTFKCQVVAVNCWLIH